MKKIILSFAALIAITISANAQVRREVPDKSNGNTEQSTSVRHGNQDKKKARHEMMKSLNLNKSQKQEVKSYNKDFKAKMAELKQNTNLSADELKSKRKALMMERKQKIDVVLNPEQKMKMQQFHKEMHGSKKMKAGA